MEEQNIASSASIASEQTTKDSGNPVNAVKSATTTVSVKSSDTSIFVLLLCLFIPILSPIIALLRGRFLLAGGIVLLGFLCIVLAAIPVLGWILILIIDLVVAIVVSKSKKETKIEVSHQA